MSRPDRIARYPDDEPIAPLVAVEPVLLPEPVPDAVEDHNPFGYPIFHADGGSDEHDCRPRVRARCRACRRELVLCTATTVEVRAMLRGSWTCSATCAGVS